MNAQTKNDLPATLDQGQTPTYDLMSAGSLLMDAGNFANLHSFAEVMAKSVATVPKHLAGNAGDCMAVTMQALQWGMNPYAVAQKTHIVSGTLGYEAQLVNAVLQATKAIKGAFKYEYNGDGPTLSCRVGAVINGETSMTWGEWLQSAQVTTKNSPLWKTNPRQQLGYLQVKNWARAFCPGAILGVYTTDELEPSSEQTAYSHTYEADPQELPVYNDKRFHANLPKYSKAIADGSKTADDIIDAISTRYQMTDEQKDAYLEFEADILTQKEAE